MDMKSGRKREGDRERMEEVRAERKIQNFMPLPCHAQPKSKSPYREDVAPHE